MTFIKDSYCLAFSNCNTLESDNLFLFAVKISFIVENSRSITADDAGRLTIDRTNFN